MSAKVVEPCSVRLKKALDARGMRQSDLCEKTQIPKSAISHYLKGSFVPKQDRAFIIAKALNINPAWLMGYDVPMEKEGERPEQEKISPSELQLTEGEKLWIDLIRKMPEDLRQKTFEMIRTALDSPK